MTTRKGTSGARRIDRSGFTLLEVMIAAILLLIMFFGLARVHGGARKQIVMEDRRRAATNVVESHLEAIRRDTTYDDLVDLHAQSTQYVVDGVTYTARNTISSDYPEAQATTILVTVSWPEMINTTAITRSVSCTTILARGLSWN